MVIKNLCLNNISIACMFLKIKLSRNSNSRSSDTFVWCLVQRWDAHNIACEYQKTWHILLKGIRYFISLCSDLLYLVEGYNIILNIPIEYCLNRHVFIDYRPIIIMNTFCYDLLAILATYCSDFIFIKIFFLSSTTWIFASDIVSGIRI